MKRNVNRFTDEFRLQVALEYIDTDQSYSELMEKYGIKGCGCIPNWIRKFELRKPTAKELEVRIEMSKNRDKTDLERQQGSKIKKLEELLKREQLKTEALDTLIDIAEKKLKIDIRKKSGSRQ